MRVYNPYDCISFCDIYFIISNAALKLKNKNRLIAFLTKLEFARCGALHEFDSFRGRLGVSVVVGLQKVGCVHVNSSRSVSVINMLFLECAIHSCLATLALSNTIKRHIIFMLSL